MIRHIVVWKLKDRAEGRSKIENARILKRELESLVPKIHEIRELKVGVNCNTSGDAYDLALISEFGSQQDLDTYINHPEHQRVAGIVKGLRETRIVVDYEF